MIDKTPPNRIIEMNLRENDINSLPNQAIDWWIVFSTTSCHLEIGLGCLFWHWNFNYDPKGKHFSTKNTFDLKRQNTGTVREQRSSRFFILFPLILEKSYVPWHLLPCVYGQVLWLLVVRGKADLHPLLFDTWDIIKLVHIWYQNN